MAATHSYAISFDETKPVVYIHDDQLFFHVLFDKVIRLHRIQEKWNFGLYFVLNDQINWINLDEDKYKSFEKLPTNELNHILLKFAIITYPLKLSNEVWSEAAATLFFCDIYLTQPDAHVPISKKQEMYAIEHLLSTKYPSQICPIRKRFAGNEMLVKAKELEDQTFWQLIRKYFDIIDMSNFLKVTGDFTCNNGRDRISLNKTNLTIVSNDKSQKYEWTEIEIMKVKGKFCNIKCLSEGKERCYKFEWINAMTAKQFSFVARKHVCQFVISSKVPIDEQFNIIKKLAFAEQEWVEKAVRLQFQLSNIDKNTEELTNENNCLKQVNKDLVNEMKKLEQSSQKELEGKRELEKKLQVFEMKTSKISQIEKENKELKKEIDKIKTEKNSLIEKHKNEIESWKLKVSVLEDRIKRTSGSAEIKKRGSVPLPNSGKLDKKWTSYTLEEIKSGEEKEQDSADPVNENL